MKVSAVRRKPLGEYEVLEAERKSCFQKVGVTTVCAKCSYKV